MNTSYSVSFSMHIAGEEKEECQKFGISSYSCQMRRENGLRKTSERESGFD